MTVRWLLLFLVSFSQPAADPPAVSEPPMFSTGRLGFTVKYKSEVSAYEVNGVFLMPGESLTLEVMKPEPSGLVLTRGAEIIPQTKKNRWVWTAPTEPGFHALTLGSSETAESMRFNVWIMVPAKNVKNGYLNEYRIGTYPDTAYRDLPVYQAPKGFVEITREHQSLAVSPHFELGDFVCKQQSGYPKYLVLRERLILKLERILEEVNKKGYACQSFHVMSGFRTPFYNHAIGNVKYSRHQWGGAADIFIDENPKDGYMDDLNKDGVIDFRDAHVLYEIVDAMLGKPWYEPFVGGLGLYKKTPSHGPFVHVDARGFRARWGD